MLSVTYRYNADTVVEVSAFDIISNTTLKLKERSPLDIQKLLTGLASSSADEFELRSVAILLDCSGSMYGDRIQEAKAACVRFLDKTDFEFVQVGLVQFGMNSSACVKVGLTQDKRQLLKGVGLLDADGGTPMAEAIDCGCGLLVSDGIKFIILFTDGGPNSRERTVEAAHRARESGIDIICIGTADADKNFLEKLASSSENNLFANDGVALMKTFGNIAEVISGKRI